MTKLPPESKPASQLTVTVALKQILKTLRNKQSKCEKYYTMKNKIFINTEESRKCELIGVV